MTFREITGLDVEAHVEGTCLALVVNEIARSLKRAIKQSDGAIEELACFVGCDDVKRHEIENKIGNIKNYIQYAQDEVVDLIGEI